MANICEVCGKELGSPGALGSHMRLHKPKEKRAKKLKANSSSEGALTLIADKLTSLVDKLSNNSSPKLSTCPDCGGELELMRDGPGIWKLKCQRCWSE